MGSVLPAKVHWISLLATGCVIVLDWGGWHWHWPLINMFLFSLIDFWRPENKCNFVRKYWFYFALAEAMASAEQNANNSFRAHFNESLMHLTLKMFTKISRVMVNERVKYFSLRRNGMYSIAALSDGELLCIIDFYSTITDSFELLKIHLKFTCFELAFYANR